MTVNELLPRAQAFHIRSASIYSSMKKRFQQKVNKKGRIMRIGREIPFTLTDFRAWLIEQLGGSTEGMARCAYSGVPVTALDLRVDHDIPVSRGGDLGLCNLRITTDTANREKGGLTGEEYRNLLSNLEGLLQRGLLHPDGYKDIRKRLRGQTAIFRKKPKALVPVFGDPELLTDSEIPF
jgi:hypothetical protein